MTKSELAKELTLAAINNELINARVGDNSSYTIMNEQVAEKVATFYNKLMEKLDLTE